ncbi:MAG: signal peptidase II [Methylococcaceae bacterium]|nr:signal peptidase II [Methylococcaceae bacterium]
MSIGKRLLLIFIVLVLCVGCDQTTKFAAESYLPDYGILSFLGGTVRLQLAHNHGAFLRLGASLPNVWRNGLLSFGVGMMLLMLLSYAALSKSATRPELLAFALLLGGGVSNLADRLMYNGYVIDFMNVGIGSLRTGIFNVADIAVMVGIILLIANGSNDRNKSVESA